MPSTDQHQFVTASDIEPLVLMQGLSARAVNGEHTTFAVIELEPNLTMPEHTHPNEQVGVVVRGEFTFTIGGETRLRRKGDMWVIPKDVPHSVDRAGADGCTLVECFSPPRADWADKAREAPSPAPLRPD
jgi:quercetin dioxygenase-like cupin family protein